MNKPIYLGLSILDLSKSVMYGFWNDYIKPNMVKIENFVICMQTASLFMQKQMILQRYCRRR